MGSAASACAEVGARLCSSHEVLELEGAGICRDLDAQPVWTSSTCTMQDGTSGVVAVAAGSDWSSELVTCVDPASEEARNGKCCADVVCTECASCSSQLGGGCLTFDLTDASVSCEETVQTSNATLKEICN